VNYVARWGKDIDDQIEQNLPDEAKVAFAIRCDELEAWPWGTGGPRSGPIVTHFGEMEGVLEYRVYENEDGEGKHVIWVTRVHW
jgi:hypothetical protein